MIKHLGLFLTISCGLYHSTGLQMPTLSVRNIASPSSNYIPTHCRLIPPLPLNIPLLCISDLQDRKGNAVEGGKVISFPCPFPRSFPTLSSLLFAIPSTYIYIYLSIFLLTPSPPICLPIYPHLSFPLNHHELLPRYLPLCVG